MHPAPHRGSPRVAWALWYASLGYRVFRLRPGAKEPMRAGWPVHATSDAAIVAEWWRSTPDANIGVCCDRGVVLDVDDKNGKPGPQSYEQLHLADTLTVKTPTGEGRHRYFADHGATRTKHGLGAGIDVRGAGSYVVGAGSSLPSGDYVLEHAMPPARLPSEIAALLQSPSEARIADDAEPDTDSALAAAVRYLAHDAPAAVEGSGGDNTTYTVARQLKRFGVSRALALQLMLELYNGRCSPPWDAATLRLKVRSAYRAREGLGSESPAADFSHGPQRLTAADLFRAPVPRPPDVPPPDWIIDRYVQAGIATGLVGPGGAGKSMLQLHLAAAIALGDGRHMGWTVPKARKVLVINNEDRLLQDIWPRLWSLLEAWGYPPDALDDKLWLYSGTAVPFRMARLVNRSEVVIDEILPALIDEICARDIGAVFLDPFVSLHQVSENDNGHIDTVARALASIAAQTGAGVMIGHHSRKPAGASAESMAGDAASARGASAFLNACRHALTLYTPSRKEAEAAGIPESERQQYARVDVAKSNIASPFTAWYRKRARPAACMPGHAPVPHMVPHDPHVSADEIRASMVNHVADMYIRGTPLAQMLARLKADYPLVYGGKGTDAAAELRAVLAEIGA